MANELKHKTVGSALTQVDWEAVEGHVLDGQATNDTIRASSATQLSRIKNEFAKSVAPGINDDFATGGYSVGSIWIDTTGDTVWINVDISAGAAVWVAIASITDPGSIPAGELGGTWAAPTVDATHSGSTHHTQSHNHSASGDGSTLTPVVLNSPANAIDALTEIAAALKSGADGTLVTGTSGTNGDIAIWNTDGDLVDGPTPPAGVIVGTSDSQTLTNKTLTSPTINTPVMGANSIDAITEIAAGLKSGADVTLVTGTSGTSGNIATWNTDGDIVDSGAALLTQSTQAAIKAETNENTYIPPDLLKHHPGIAKVWISWTYSGGTPSDAASYNVASLADNATGDLDVVFTTAFSSTAYAVVASGDQSSANVTSVNSGKLTTDVRIVILNTSSASADLDGQVAIFGDQ